ncbi:polyprenol-phosphate-mannose-dependent alpha-(1-2)-phosphatidylinositol mannoside mannosyltransferase [Planctomycetota bacterium]|nr:polyprenol-phosphate-mannose-dependent alpha-(1-2)-phosphatidylinositol mannoside mannosyltransferase [Planctomycetota bacterium]
MARLHWVLLLIALGVVTVCGAIWFGARAETKHPELPVYVLGGERMAAGGEIYLRGNEAKPFTYPPFAAVPFALFRFVPIAWQPAAWFVINFSLLLAMLAWLQKWAASAWPDAPPARLALTWVIVSAIAARYVFSVFENQSHDLLLMGPMVLATAMWCRATARGSAGAGAFVGLAAAIKATPLLCLLMFTLRRSFPAVVALLLTFGALSLLPDLFFPRQDGDTWLHAWYSINLRSLSVGQTATGAWSSHSFLNQSLGGSLTRIFTNVPVDQDPFTRPDAALLNISPGALFNVILMARLAVLLLLAAVALRARKVVLAACESTALLVQRRVALGEIGAMLCGMVLLSPMSSKAHFCVLMLPALFCVDRVLRCKRSDPWLVVTVAAAAILSTFSSKDILGKELGNFLLGLGSVTWIALLLLLATLRAMRPEPVLEHA